MGIQYTSNFHIPFMDPATPFADVQVVTQQLAQLLDTAMGKAGYVPPDSTTFAALAAKVDAITARSTPPVDLPILAPLAAYGGGFVGLRAWREGYTGYLVGFLTAVPAGSAAGAHELAQLPAGLAPASLTPGPLIINGNSGGRVDIRNNGSIALSQTLAIANGNWAGINMNWSLR